MDYCIEQKFELKDINYYFSKEKAEKLSELFKKNDFLTIKNYYKDQNHFKVLQGINDKVFLQKFAPILEILTLIGFAYEKFDKFDKAKMNFDKVEECFKRLESLRDKYSKVSQDEVLKSMPNTTLSAIVDLKKYCDELLNKNISRRAQALSNIAYINFKTKKFNKAIKIYKDVLEMSIEPMDIIKARIDLADSYYEETKQNITFIKTVVIIVLLVILAVIKRSFILNFFSSIAIGWYFLIPFIIISLSRFVYINFYSSLRRIKKFSVKYLFLNEDWFKNLGHILKEKIFAREAFEFYKESIKEIEEIKNNKEFDVFFAICKLYYCLGEYKQATFYGQIALNFVTVTPSSKKHIALVYHYLARIAYKNSNHMTAIKFYEKTTKTLVEEKFSPNNEIHSEPRLLDMIKYAQENRDKLDEISFNRTYWPVIMTILITLSIAYTQNPATKTFCNNLKSYAYELICKNN